MWKIDRRKLTLVIRLGWDIIDLKLNFEYSVNDDAPIHFLKICDHNIDHKPSLGIMEEFEGRTCLRDSIWVCLNCLFFF